ncbi:MAG: M23 family metallopeptidase [Candidatus Uhrbacteria bacterium]|nr:M23 family metallopeptidase [Candidatus Uhrbacteria bacterium]
MAAKGCAAGIKPLLPVLGSFLYWILAWIILPLYKFIVILRIRIGHILVSTHGFVFLLFTNRYVGHTAMVVIAVMSVASQMPTQNASASDTQNSLLYTLVTNGENEIVDEPVSLERSIKNANYLGSDTIQALPGIDFDYEDENQPPADLTIPGSIAVREGQEPFSSDGRIIPTRTATEIYQVEDGDTVAAIAKKFGVNVGTVAWANNLNSRSIIRPGDRLKIPPVSGLLHIVKRGDTIQKIAERYRAKTDDVSSANHFTPNYPLRVGEEIVVPGGIPPEPPRLAKPRVLANVRPNIPLSQVRNKAFDVYQELNNSGDDVRIKPPDIEGTPVAKNKLLWPTKLRAINQYFGWRHTGLDVDGDYTDPIYAAEDGIVEKSGWNSGGYGLMVKVDHENGIKTLYAHASKLFVEEGERVKRGQVIAMTGTTGRSTGTHLHFEVIINGRRVNPLGYIR